MEAHELDSNKTPSLGRRIQVNLFECSSSILEPKFLQSFGVLKSSSKNESGCPLFIVVLEDKSHFGLISLKISSRL